MGLPAAHDTRSASILLAVAWFFCMGGLGIYFPYFGLYLKENAGLPGTQVGLILGITPLVGMLAQPFWGQLADRTGARTRVVAVLGFGSAAGYVAYLGSVRFSALAMVTVGLAIFSTALLPSLVAVSMALLANLGPQAFGKARAWGTVGFGVLVFGFPPLLHTYQQHAQLPTVAGGPSEPGLELMFIVSAIWTGLGGLVVLFLPRFGAVSFRAERGDWRQLLTHGAYMRTLLVVFLAYLFLQGPMTHFPNLVRHYGGNLDSVSRMWIPMLVIEVPLVAFVGGALARFGPRRVMGIAIFSAGLRWVIYGSASALWMIFGASFLHGVMVAGLMVGAPLYVESIVPERLRSTAQALLATVGMGVGAGISNIAAGWLFESAGPTAPYLVAGYGAMLLALLLPALIRR
jgi:MFS transporter, PPP family, 3-phenylpropionic acid transporter